MVRFQVRWINKRYLKKKEYRYKHYSIDFPAKQCYSALFFVELGSSRRGEKNRSSSSTAAALKLPEELPSVEEELKLFAAISGLIGAVLGLFVGQKA